MKHQTKLPDIIGWNVICQVITHLSKIWDIRLWLLWASQRSWSSVFSKLCICYCSDICKNHTFGVKSIFNQSEKVNPKMTDEQWNFIWKDGWIGQVTKGSKKHPVCVIEQAEDHNLPLGIVVNRCMAMTKTRVIPVILVNANIHNIWIQQTLLAANVFYAEYHQMEPRDIMERRGDNLIYHSNL